ncbi:zf-HC2 domain-containing protein [Luedemannella flava]|uniref:Zf-HC2 domain-containing protein n=1 Tax=Luedemannella flava TaxID=349316 RepID=A0ABN2MNZ4_9ACTN
MTCPYTHDDGAYVLGALSAADRAAFEAHLPACPPCREAVASLAVLPGLLGRLAPTAAVELDTSVRAGTDAAEGIPPTILPRVLATATARRRRSVRRWALVAAACAAALATVVGLGVHAMDDRSSGGPTVAGPATTGPTPAPSVLPTPLTNLRPMTPVSSAVPVFAELGLRTSPDGTVVEMTCGYIKASGGYSDRRWTLHLDVWPATGEPERVATWTAKAGDELRVSTLTHFSPTQIARVDLRTASGRTLLTWTPT